MKSNRILSILLAALMLASLFTACAQKKTSDPAETGEQTDETNTESSWLTNIYRESAAYAMPDEDTRLYDPNAAQVNEDGSLSMLAAKWNTETDADGNNNFRTDYYRLTYEADGTLRSSELLSMPDVGDTNGINFVVLAGEDVVCLMTGYDPMSPMGQTFQLVRLSSDGKTTESGDLAALFGGADMGFFYPDRLTIDRDGYCYLTCGDRILVLTPDFVRVGEIMLNGWVDTMALSPADGLIYVEYFADDHYEIAPIDRGAMAFGAGIPIGSSADSLHFGANGRIYFGSEKGVSVCSPDDGSEELLMNAENSDLIARDMMFAGAWNDENLLLAERDGTTYDYILKRYTKAPDVDLSAVKVITVASAYSLEYTVTSAIVDYNRAHPETRIISVDYTEYATEENDWDPTKKMTLDMTNGLFKPDVVFVYPDASVVDYLTNNGLCVNLDTCMEKDPDFDPADVLGCIRRTFSTDDGTLFGLPAYFDVDTLLGRTDVVGDRTGWTLAEMLDFAKTLPDGVSLINDLTQDTASVILLGQNGYGAFIDMENGTADFESGAFVDYLNYLATLPKEIDYASRPDDYYETQYLQYYEGKVALKDMLFWNVSDWLSLPASFGTENVTPIGYPAEDRIGAAVTTNGIFMITNFCENADAAWDFLGTIVKPEIQTDDTGAPFHGIPTFRSTLKELCKTYENNRFIFYADGSASWGTIEEMEDAIEWYASDVPSITVDYDAEKLESIVEYLDNYCGVPTAQAIPESLAAIVNEDITAFLGGSRSAEETARITQSRVKIWLAEHN